jgi:hypothetical protein
MTSPSQDAQAAQAPLALTVGEAAQAPGGWLRQQRQARGWTVPQMARKLREAAKAAGDALPAHDALVGMIRRWERGFGVSERYRLHFCRFLSFTVGSRNPIHAIPGSGGRCWQR